MRVARTARLRDGQASARYCRAGECDQYRDGERRGERCGVAPSASGRKRVVPVGVAFADAAVHVVDDVLVCALRASSRPRLTASSLVSCTLEARSLPSTSLAQSAVALRYTVWIHPLGHRISPTNSKNPRGSFLPWGFSRPNIGADERTRTSTSLHSRRPERRASTNSATSASPPTLAFALPRRRAPPHGRAHEAAQAAQPPLLPCTAFRAAIV